MQQDGPPTDSDPLGDLPQLRAHLDVLALHSHTHLLQTLLAVPESMRGGVGEEAGEWLAAMREQAEDSQAEVKAVAQLGVSLIDLISEGEHHRRGEAAQWEASLRELTEERDSLAEKDFLNSCRLEDLAHELRQAQLDLSQQEEQRDHQEEQRERLREKIDLLEREVNQQLESVGADAPQLLNSCKSNSSLRLAELSLSQAQAEVQQLTLTNQQLRDQIALLTAPRAMQQASLCCTPPSHSNNHSHSYSQSRSQTQLHCASSHSLLLLHDPSLSHFERPPQLLCQDLSSECPAWEDHLASTKETTSEWAEAKTSYCQTGINTDEPISDLNSQERELSFAQKVGSWCEVGWALCKEKVVTRRIRRQSQRTKQLLDLSSY